MLREADALADQAQCGELGDKEYMEQYQALFAPYAAQIASDPQVQAIWHTLGKALSYQELTERYRMRGKR